MASKRSRRLRRSLLAAVAAGTVGLALAVVPTSFASQPQAPAPTHGSVMYDISVRALDGNAVALAQRLTARGFDLLEKREGAVVHVLGTVSTARALAGVSGAAVVSTAPA